MLVTCDFGVFDYGVSKTWTKHSFKIALAASSMSYDQGDGGVNKIMDTTSIRFNFGSAKAGWRLCTEGRQRF